MICDVRSSRVGRGAGARARPADLSRARTISRCRAAGARVVVPVGPRTLTGVVLGEAAAADTAYTIKPIKQVLDDHAFVPPTSSSSPSGCRTITWPVPAPRWPRRCRRMA